MNKLESLKNEIAKLPPSMLVEVEGFVRKKKKEMKSRQKPSSLFKRRKDKAWGMVDCYSFVVMKKRRVKYALTFDEHFRQAGFETPLIG